MSEYKEKHNKAWVATDKYKENYERIFGKKRSSEKDSKDRRIKP